MPRSKKPRKKYALTQRSRRESILGVEMEHDTAWRVDGKDKATVKIKIPDGSIYLPEGYYQGRWLMLNGAIDTHAMALERLKRLEFNWQVWSWALGETPTGEQYREETSFNADEPVKLDALHELAEQAMAENKKALGLNHYRSSGWRVVTTGQAEPYSLELLKQAKKGKKSG